MSRFVAGAIALMFTYVVFGQIQADTIKVYFEVSRDEYPSRQSADIHRFIEKIDSANALGAIERIDVFGYASPEGSPKLNKRLAERRSRNVADYIIARTGVAPGKVSARGMGEAWDDLRALIEANPDVPYRSRLLDIIDNTPEWIYDSGGRIVDGRKKQLMDLAGGRPYRWLLANIFPKLRYATTVSVQYAPIEPAPVIEEIPEPVDTVSTVEPVVVDDVVYVVSDTAAMAAEPLPDAPLHRLAIKTNLLYDAALLPNLEVEWRINDDWSLALEGDVAWWGKYSKNKSYRLAVVSPEVKRWFRTRAPLHGFYAGAFAGGGLYDFEKSTRGYRGEGAMAGLSVGYMWPIGRCLSLEAAIGAGYLYTRYKEYVPVDGHHVYQRTKDLNYFGPLKVKFSLVWRLWDTNKRTPDSKTAVRYEK